MKKIIIILIFISIKSFSHEFTPCEKGMADVYPCENIDLMSRVHIEHMGGEAGVDSGTDIWGWTDPQTNKEYALMGLSFGTSFVDITHPKMPVYLGTLPTATAKSTWRDIKAYKNHAYIVSEANEHGIQVFDLTQLRDIASPPIDFTATNHYTRVGSVHNIVINEDTGFAYAVGGGGDGNIECNKGLHMINIQDPANPQFAGCFADDGYTHDAQCVIYSGPDQQYQGKEICFNSNEDTLTIVDVSNKSNPTMISRKGYDNSQYTHQGWLTEDHRYYLMNDELDERNLGHKTKTYIWDLVNLDFPQLIGFYNGPEQSIDHNLYIKGNYAFLTNYSSGLSILDITDIGNGVLKQTAKFDGFPAHNAATYDGAWSNYPYFASGNVIMSDDVGGLFILKPKLCPVVEATQGLTAIENGDNQIDLSWVDNLEDGESYNIYRSEGGCAVDNFKLIANGITDAHFYDKEVTGGAKVGYKIAKEGTETEFDCESKRSVCVETQTTGTCTIAPLFTGINSVQTSNTSTCGVDLSWSNATSYCDSGVSYDVFRSEDPSFEPNESNKVASGIINQSWHDSQVINDKEYYYLVRSKDLSNNSYDENLVKLSDKVQGELANGLWTAGAEVGDEGFGPSNRHVGWETVTDRKKSGERSYWSQNSSSACNDLMTDTISLTPGQQSTLSFWTAYDIEYQYDGGIVEVSTDENQWDKPEIDPQYPNVFRNSNDECGYEFNDKSFTGTDLTWKQHTMDLSEYQGQEIKIRWNYSSNTSTNGEGWFLDEIKVTNSQNAAACETIRNKPQNGLWYDRGRSGHGFVVEPIGRDNLYFTVFYSYKEDGSPEWYTSLSTLENNVLNINMESGTLLRFIRDYENNSNILDTSIGTNILKIDFNSQTVSNSNECNDGQFRPIENMALASWQLGDQQGSWCIEPLINEESYPSPDFGGTWWTGSSDSGWGISLSFSGDLMVATIYYFDALGNARWAQGIQSGFQTGQAITLDMKEFTGFPRNGVPSALSSVSAGSLTLTLNSNTQSLETDGILSIDVTYQGTEGGNWSREDIPVTIFTEPH